MQSKINYLSVSGVEILLNGIEIIKSCSDQTSLECSFIELLWSVHHSSVSAHILGAKRLWNGGVVCPLWSDHQLLETVLREMSAVKLLQTEVLNRSSKP